MAWMFWVSLYSFNIVTHIVDSLTATGTPKEREKRSFDAVSPASSSDSPHNKQQIMEKGESISQIPTWFTQELFTQSMEKLNSRFDNMQASFSIFKQPLMMMQQQDLKLPRLI